MPEVLAIDFDYENERLQKANFRKTISMKQLPARNEGEELLKALETIDSRDNEMVDIRLQLNTDLSKQYVLSQKQNRPVATPPTIYEHRVFTPSSENRTTSDQVFKKRTYQPIDNTLKVNLQEEFKRQLEYLKSPYDTFHNGRFTRQTLMSTKGFTNNQDQFEEERDRKTPDRMLKKDNQANLRHVVSHQHLLGLAQGQKAERSDEFQDKFRRYESMSTFDPLLESQIAIQNYRNRHKEPQIITHEHVVAFEAQSTPLGDKNLEVKADQSDKKQLHSGRLHGKEG